MTIFMPLKTDSVGKENNNNNGLFDLAAIAGLVTQSTYMQFIHRELTPILYTQRRVKCNRFIIYTTVCKCN